MEPLGLAEVCGALERSVPRDALHPRGCVEVALAADWSPAEVWPGALERRCWSVGFRVVRGAWLAPAAEDRLAAELGGRGPVTPAEVLARAVGGGLVVAFSDAQRMAYVAVYRERRMQWGLMLHDGVALVRALGRDVQVHAPPPRVIPEGDRLGVLEAGLWQWLREPVALDDGEARLLLPETLDGLLRDASWTTLSDGGAWRSGKLLAAPRRLA